ncbi:MAG: Do family serine endopeptidase [Devosia sp.]|nr:Do family serine endopeptidase [Devosia sp.]
MRSTFLSRTRRWVGASALAVIIGLSGGASFFVATSQHAAADTANVTAKLQQAAQITAPNVTAPVSFADLVEAVKPAVVSIVVEAQTQDSSSVDGGSFNNQIPDLPDDNPLKHFFDQFRNGNGSQVPRPHKYMAAGSGFAISADGYFVTNNHVVQDSTKVTVQFANGDEKPAKVVGTDEKTDLAVIKVDGLTDQPFVKLADTAPRVGDWVMAVGNPFGLGGTVTAGIVSALNRDIGGTSDDAYMQIDAAVNSGNSGGPDFNLKGEVVGVNTAIFSPNGGSVGIAFAIPASTVKQITSDLIKNGSVTRGFLGVGIQDVTRDIADSVGLKEAKGAVVTEATKGSPADKAGIKSGDVITAVDGDTIDNARALSRTIGGKAPGTTVDVTVWRDNAEQHFSVKLDTLSAKAADTAPAAKQTPPDATVPVASSVGLTLVPNSEGAGVLVQDIDPESVAASKGFAVGDTILEVDNKAVNTPKAFQSAIDAVKASGRGTALIKAERNGQARFVGLPLSDK